MSYQKEEQFEDIGTAGVTGAGGVIEARGVTGVAGVREREDYLSGWRHRSGGGYESMSSYRSWEVQVLWEQWDLGHVLSDIWPNKKEGHVRPIAHSPFGTKKTKVFMHMLPCRCSCH